MKKNGINSDGIFGIILIDMYMKCGCVENVLEVFYSMEKKEVLIWNAVIFGFVINGLVEMVFEMFSEMKICRVIFNEIIFIGVFGVCRYTGLVEEGRGYFNFMVKEYKIELNVKYYGCMVDLFGRTGLFKEVEEFIMSMLMEFDVIIWGVLFGVCRKYGDNEMGERVGRKFIEL